MKWVKTGSALYDPHSNDAELDEYVKKNRYERCEYAEWIAAVGYEKFREGWEYWLEVFWRIHRLLNEVDNGNK